MDFLRRCKNIEEAIEIIDYLKKREEIQPEEADLYYKKLKEEGLESFGYEKGLNYYEREG